MYKYEVALNKDVESALINMDGSSESGSVGERKFPNSFLSFKRSNVPDSFVFALDVNKELAYLVDSNKTVLVYKNIATDNPELVETGRDLNPYGFGRVAQIKSTSDGGLLLFARNPLQVQIFKMANPSAEPVLKYESTVPDIEGWDARFTPGFGIKAYHNGLESIVLAGVYGRGFHEQDLLLSTDNGESFNIIKKTGGAGTTARSHWHDVEIDVYHGMLWAAEGDGETKNAYWSDTLGKTWHTLQPESSSQPTVIIAFPDKVIFGRDDNVPGLDIVKKPNLRTEYNNPYEFKPHKEFKVHTAGHNYYAQTPIVDGKEAYMSFSLGVGQEPRLLMGTGDWGNTWHFVRMGTGSSVNANTNISALSDMDNDHVYGLIGNNADGTSSVGYAKRVDWQ